MLAILKFLSYRMNVPYDPKYFRFYLLHPCTASDYACSLISRGRVFRSSIVSHFTSCLYCCEVCCSSMTLSYFLLSFLLRSFSTQCPCPSRRTCFGSSTATPSNRRRGSSKRSSSPLWRTSTSSCPTRWRRTASSSSRYSLVWHRMHCVFACDVFLV